MIGIPEAKMSDVAKNANLTIGTDQRRSKYSRNKKIKIGDKFGRWTVIGFDKKVTWKAICVCMCGNKKSVLKSSLNNKSSKSCGCIAAEINRERMYKHGMASHINPTYNVWTNMIARCHRKTHPQYRLYGSRGIEVCERWKSNYTNFLEDMGEKPYNKTIDRINNNDGYYKENCRWVSHKINCQNQRNSKKWHVNGVVYNSLEDASESLNVDPATIKGWCDGYTVNKKYYPPKRNCFSEMVY